MTSVTVIVVNYNAGEYLRGCINSLVSQTMSDFEVILVDNASQDCSLDSLPSLPENFKIIRSKENLGFAAANNLAARAAQGEWLALLNPDAVAAPDWLEKLLKAVTIRPRYRMVASLQLSLGNKETLDGAGDCYSICGYAWRGGFGHSRNSAPAAGEVFAPCGASAFYPKDAFLKAGGFEESYFCYIEDIDLAFRLRLAGEKCQFVPDCVIEHAGSAISDQHSGFAIYHSFRNTLWTICRNIPGLLLPITVPLWMAASTLFYFKSNQDRRKQVRRSIVDAIGSLKDVVQQRAKIQATKCVSSLSVAKMIAWDVRDLRTHVTKVQPFDPA